MILYKYCRPERIDVLRSGMVMLSRPRASNDPFELSPHISKFDDPNAMEDDVWKATKEFVVLALAENRDSLLMWAHYTDRHRAASHGLQAPLFVRARAPLNADLCAELHQTIK